MSLILRNVKGSALTYTEGDANLLYLESLFTGATSGLTFKELQIGDWNMDADMFKGVAHGLSATEWKTVRNISATIRDDADAIYSDFGTYLDISSGGNTINVQITNIGLTRALGGLYDNPNFDSTSYNRGFITFWYTPD